MAVWNNPLRRRIALGLVLILPLVVGAGTASAVQAQAPAPAAPAAASALGTVKSISGNSITMTTDKGQTIAVTVVEGAKVYQLAVGSTDLKTAKPGQLSDVAVGDRTLMTGKAGEAPDTLTALRVILMKHADIAQMQADEQADWRARGTGGHVTAIDLASGSITITSGAKKLVVATTAKTDFRRFAGDSVKYQDAKPGTIAEIHVGDQLQARGAKSADGTSMQAEEVVSGSFKDLSGLILSADPASGKITLKDLATKKVVTVDVTANSDIRKMPEQMATMFAARNAGGDASQAGGGRRGGGGSGGPGGGGSGGRSGGADLAQMITRMPSITPADLHKGDATMIVATEPTPGANILTAVTVLTGVDAILTANPNGGMSLSMSLGGGGGGEQ